MKPFTIKTFRIVLAYILCSAILFKPFFLKAQGLDSIPHSNQNQFLIHSKVMNEDRTVWVHTPADYNSSDNSYPVLYLLDGGKHYPYVKELVDYLSDFEQPYISPMIVVGIPNIDRGRDLTPQFTGNKELARDSGAGKYLQFIKTELIPHIEENYRTAPYRILEGHSLGGLFTVFANVQEPDLFQASIIISPALAGRETSRKVMAAFTAFLKNSRQLNRKLFVTLGDENTESVDLLTQQLKNSAPVTCKWSFKQYKGENHFSAPYKSMYDGLRFIYANWFMDVFLNRNKISWTDIDEHFKKLSAEFGYSIHPTEDFVNQTGYQQLNAGNINEAIGLFQQNIRDHPKSWNVYDSMGEAYMKAGNKKLAIEYYEKSLQLNPGNEGGRKMLRKLL